ncbi:MAG: hypothetical protein K8T10_02750 [Candidatus Eremiobacteraeota bacterium]|nr:hypothetical protein [Candidatus Eremiobacteraeota bacterium]
MNVLTSIKHKLHIGREIPMGENSKTGETGAKIDTQDKVSLSSGSGEEKNSMSLKDAATSGGVGFAIGLGMGNRGAINEIKEKIGFSKSGDKTNSQISGNKGEEPPITAKEFKALKKIYRKEYWEGFRSGEQYKPNCYSGMMRNVQYGLWTGAGIAFLSFLVGVTAPLTLGAILVGPALICGTVAGDVDGRDNGKHYRNEWKNVFSEKSEAESMVALNKEYPDIWMKMMK